MPGRVPRVTRTDAIVLRHRRLGEADRVVTLLTPLRGKLDAVAKGALRPRSKLAGHLEPLTHVEVLLAHGRTLDIVTQAQQHDAFPALHADLDRLASGLYLLELADRLTLDRAESEPAYALLLLALRRLALGDGLQLVTRSYELALLDAAGFRPQWRNCVGCDTPVVADRASWSPLAGGVVCSRCLAAHPEAVAIESTVLRVLRAYQDGPYEQAARIRLTPELAAGLERVMHALMRAVTERALGSARFVADARRPQALPSMATGAGVYTREQD
jgi:DNA repair protein RecO (recombination protein O)